MTAGPETLVALFLVGLVAACFDAVAGGGGLMTLPALLVAGLDPVAAIATNKVQSSVGATSATFVFARRGLLDRRLAPALVIGGIVAAMAGAASVAHVPRQALAAAMPLLLVGVALYFGLARPPSDQDRRPRVPRALIAGLYVPAVAFYDGIFGPGTGLFLTLGFVALAGFGLVAATAQAKLANAASNIGALAWFAASGHVAWRVGVAMAAGAMVGGQLGSHLVLGRGARLVRPVAAIVAVALCVRLLADPGNPLRRAVAALAGG